MGLSIDYKQVNTLKINWKLVTIEANLTCMSLRIIIYIDRLYTQHTQTLDRRISAFKLNN